MENMYSHVVPVSKRKHRIHLGIEIKLLVVLIISVLIIGLFIWAYAFLHRFRAYIADVSNSTTYAYQNESMVITDGDVSYPVTGDDIYRFFREVATAKMGKTYKAVPDTAPELAIDFGDSSSAKLWITTVIEDNKEKMGTMIDYVNQDGEHYIYEVVNAVRVDNLRAAFYPHKKNAGY